MSAIFSTHAPRGSRPSTVETYAHALKLFAECLPPDANWQSAAIREAASTLRKRPYRTASVGIFIRAWRTFLNYCHDEGLCHEALARYIKSPMSEPRRDPLLGPPEMEILLAEVRRGKNALRNESMLTVLYDCGLRAGELCALTVRGVNLSARILTVPTGKTSGRTVPFGRRTGRILQRCLLARDIPALTDAPLFPTYGTNRAMNHKVLWTYISRLEARAGLRIHPHQFRHSFAVNYLRNGGDTFSLQRILGHSSLVMTRWYSQLADADVQARHAAASPADRLARR